MYIGSTRIQDPRYRKTSYGVMTTLFATTYISGIAVPSDDMKEGVIEVIPLPYTSPEVVAPEHRGLYAMLLEHRAKILASQ